MSNKQDIISAAFDLIIRDPYLYKEPCYVLISGRTRTGKSYRALALLADIYRNHRIKLTPKTLELINIINPDTADQQLDIIIEHQLPAFIFHEGSFNFDSRNQFDKGVRDFIKKMNTIAVFFPLGLVVFIICQKKSDIALSIKMLATYNLQFSKKKIGKGKVKYYVEFYVPVYRESWQDMSDHSTGHYPLSYNSELDVDDPDLFSPLSDEENRLGLIVSVDSLDKKILNWFKKYDRGQKLLAWTALKKKQKNYKKQK